MVLTNFRYSTFSNKRTKNIFMGLGQYDLWFIRDKEKREVDFLVSENKNPWFLVEVKLSSKGSLSKNYKNPIIVPAQTFLNQLI